MEHHARPALLFLTTLGVLLLAVGLFLSAGAPFVIGGLVVLLAAAVTR